jgi:hypothetical protein
MRRTLRSRRRRNPARQVFIRFWGSVVAAFLAVDAEGKSLEDIATPLSVIAKPPQTIFRSGGALGPLPSAGD